VLAYLRYFIDAGLAWKAARFDLVGVAIAVGAAVDPDADPDPDFHSF
jgi:hypothetical protein